MQLDRYGTVQPRSIDVVRLPLQNTVIRATACCHVDDGRGRGSYAPRTTYSGEERTKLKSMVGTPSTEALAMAGADWARPSSQSVVVGDEEAEDAPPPAHLRAFEAFLETVVPPDMALAFGREEAARGARSRRKDVQEKLKLWAKAVAREARRGALGGSRQQATTTSPRLVAHAREAVPPVLARPPGEEPSSIAARGSGSKDKGAPTLQGQQQGRVAAGKLAAHPNALLVPSPRSGRPVEACTSKPLPTQDIKCT